MRKLSVVTRIYVAIFGAIIGAVVGVAVGVAAVFALFLFLTIPFPYIADEPGDWDGMVQGLVELTAPVGIPCGAVGGAVLTWMWLLPRKPKADVGKSPAIAEAIVKPEKKKPEHPEKIRRRNRDRGIP